MTRAAPIQVELYLCQYSQHDEDGWLEIQPDAYGERGAANHGGIFPYGISGRPLDPVTDDEGNITEGCPMLGFWHGGACYLLPLNDTRHVPGLPTLQKGESLQYGGASNYVRCHADSSISMLGTSDGTPTGQVIAYKQGPAGMTWQGPWGTQKFDLNFWEAKHWAGASIIMGGIGGIPHPLGQLSTYCIVRAAQFKVKASIIALGPDAGVFDAAAKATPISVLFTEVGVALAALQTAVASGPNPGAGTSAPVVAQAILALAGSLALIRSSSVSVT